MKALREKCINNGLFEDTPWVLQTPYDIRDEAMRDLLKAYKTNFAAKRQHFDMKFKSKKAPSDSIAILSKHYKSKGVFFPRFWGRVRLKPEKNCRGTLYPILKCSKSIKRPSRHSEIIILNRKARSLQDTQMETPTSAPLVLPTFLPKLTIPRGDERVHNRQALQSRQRSANPTCPFPSEKRTKKTLDGTPAPVLATPSVSAPTTASSTESTTTSNPFEDTSFDTGISPILQGLALDERPADQMIPELTLDELFGPEILELISSLTEEIQRLPSLATRPVWIYWNFYHQSWTIQPSKRIKSSTRSCLCGD